MKSSKQPIIKTIQGHCLQCSSKVKVKNVTLDKNIWSCTNIWCNNKNEETDFNDVPSWVKNEFETINITDILISEKTTKTNILIQEAFNKYEINLIYQLNKCYVYNKTGHPTNPVSIFVFFEYCKKNIQSILETTYKRRFTNFYCEENNIQIYQYNTEPFLIYFRFYNLSNPYTYSLDKEIIIFRHDVEEIQNKIKYSS